MENSYESLTWLIFIYYKEGGIGVSMFVVYLEVPINICFILAIIVIFIPVGGCESKDPSSCVER